MSEEPLKAFLDKVKADTSLQEELKGAADVDAVIDIAKEAGFTVSGDEIKAAQSAPQELSDEELEGVAGGVGALIGEHFPLSTGLVCEKLAIEQS